MTSVTISAPFEVDLPWELLPARQQPEWRAHPAFTRVQQALAAARPLVTRSEIEAAHRALASVAAGAARVLQAGDCAETFADADPATTEAKARLVDLLADRLGERAAQEVVRFGRMAGQHAKPRSAPHEVVDGVSLPAFRGELVNSPEPTAAARRHDPVRMLRAYRASAAVTRDLRSYREAADVPGRSGPWSSHEALVLDYEGALVRTDPATGEAFLTSTHFPWIGERTRQHDHAHVRLLASVGNPVACKVGPTATPEEVVRLCALLDPDRVPGRLTLIARMGRGAVGEALPPLARAVRRAGHPVVWLSDPMHGNTVRTKSGRKTRHLRDIIEEATAFRRVLDAERLHAGGLHLEVAATDVTECVGGPVPDEEALHARYESLCDPRLNPEQALAVVEAVF